MKVAVHGARERHRYHATQEYQAGQKYHADNDGRAGARPYRL